MNPIKKIFGKGSQKKAYPVELIRRMKIVNHANIDTVFDIGANVGQYGMEMRGIGYNKKIISFEPLKTAYEKLEKASLNDDNWIINNYAIGDENIKSMINVSGNSVSSSILNILPEHVQSAPESGFIAQEEIEIKTLDSIFNSFCNKENKVLVKIDTQGFEKNVIDGAKESLNRIKIIQVEMSILPLYENEMLYMAMINYLDDRGFQLYALENGFEDLKTGQLLQVDGIFVQRALN
jgi:FkbM family methyltransferase